MKNTIVLAPKTRILMGSELGMSPRLLTQKIREYKLDIPKGDILPKHQKLIYDLFGYPFHIQKEWYDHL